MIKANELRIGNLVYAEVGLPSLDIHQIKPKDIFDISLGLVRIYPIPLTEEWLVKAGFVVDGEGDYCKGDFCFRWQFNALTLLLDMGHIKPPLMHLHQLQNLYFALAGQELTINLQ